MFCTKCGTENKDGSRFCSSCGVPLHQGSDSSVSTDESKDVQESKVVIDELDKNTETRSDENNVKDIPWDRVTPKRFLIGLGILIAIFSIKISIEESRVGKDIKCSSLFTVMNPEVDVSKLIGQLMEKEWVDNCLKTNDDFVDQQYKDNIK